MKHYCGKDGCRIVTDEEYERLMSEAEEQAKQQPEKNKKLRGKS